MIIIALELVIIDIYLLFYTISVMQYLGEQHILAVINCMNKGDCLV